MLGNLFRSFGLIALLTVANLKTTAQNWQPLTNGLPVNARVQAIAGNGSKIVIGVGMPLDGTGIYISTDNGNSWSKTANGPSGPIYADANSLLVTENVILASRLVTGELFRSVNNGASWQLATGIPADGGVSSIDWDGTNFYAQVIALGKSYGPYRSTDGGATWTPIHTGLTGSPQRLAVLNGRVFSTQLSGGLFVSANQGGSWSLVTPQLAATNFPPARLTVQGDKLFLGVSGSLDPSIISVTGNATSWQAASAGLPSSFSERDLGASSAAVFAAGQNGSLPSIWQSLDSGATWAELTASGLNIAPASIGGVNSVWVHDNQLFASVNALNGTNGFFRLTLDNGKFNQAPSLVTSPASVSVGEGQSVTFNVLAAGSAPISYQWRSNGVAIAGATSSTLTLNNITTNFAASYSAIAWNSFGTNTTTNAVLTVLSTAPGNVDFNFAVAPMGSEFAGFIFGGEVNKVLVQADKRILVAGNFNRVGGTLGGALASGGVVCGHIVRYLPDGALDTSFSLTNGAGGVIKALAIQPDGKILIGGQFTTYQGTPRGRLARLNQDGTLDTTFLATGGGFNGDVNAIAVQPNGNILVGGNFTTFNNTSRAYLARLTSTGELDATFLSGLIGPANRVNTLVWHNGGVYVGGNFSTFNGVTQGYATRLMESGAIDTSFDVANGFSSEVNSLAVDKDGKLLAVGTFSTYRGTTAARIARLNTNGTLDTVFGSGFNQVPYSVVTQPDGKVIVGGNFTTAAGSPRVRLVRFHADGSLDMEFNPAGGPSAQVYTLALQSDGQLLIGGSFTSVNGQSRYLLARIFAAPLTTTPTLPPELHYQRLGATLELSWEGNFVLQSNHVAQATGWITLPGTSPMVIPTTGTTGFFRLVTPAP